MKLDIYFATRFGRAFAMVAGVFILLFILVDSVEQLRKFDADMVGFSGIATLTLLNAPQGVYEILPLIVVLSTLVLYVGLARSSELVVTRAAGRSALRSLISPVLMAALIGALGVALLNPIVAATSRQYEALTDRITGASQVLSVSREGLWLRQGAGTGQTVIRAARSNLDGTELYDVTFMGFRPDGTPDYRIEAEEAELIDGAWDLTGAKKWRLADVDNPELTATTEAEMQLPSNLTRDQIRDSFGTPSAIPIWELPGFINRLEAAGFSARAHRVWFQMELSLPLMLVAMVMIGAGFTMRHTRMSRTGLKVLYAVLFAFSIYFLRNFARIMSEGGQIPVGLAVWGPPTAAILLTMGLLLHLEEG
ncbi:LPS export ABC transporter permease LptG [Aliiroseovarius sp. PTFE2010]|uniref:LPS export ABC transporter permease LptG n=1 Tax=Aliiroseovarius sp. PTFE2010 TaxID=3417190 RepID=UPI003CE7F18E